ncbi:hypothetical protein LJC59_07250 [Desulfovibrio sp. OttesenSCG-928-A18]|nr:hypothetical protein [Desulfovibrio sp. OttesenSCG-928-A18]
MNTDPLNCRLRNCLATILELEESLGDTHLGSALHKEFSVLKEVMGRLEDVSVAESDVCRIEAATGRFLAELTESLAGSTAKQARISRILH